MHQDAIVCYICRKEFTQKFAKGYHMTSSLSNLAENLAEGVDKIKCKDCVCFLEYKSVKDNLIIYKCLSCNKNYSNTIDEELERQFRNTFKYSNTNINIFLLLLRKVVYP